MAVDRGMRLVQHGVFDIELADRLDAPPRVALAEHRVRFACIRPS